MQVAQEQVAQAPLPPAEKEPAAQAEQVVPERPCPAAQVWQFPVVASQVAHEQVAQAPLPPVEKLLVAQAVQVVPVSP